MVRFLCIYSAILYHKSKKFVYISSGAIHKSLEQVKTLNHMETEKIAETTRHIRKSVSLGSDLIDYDGRTSADEYPMDSEYTSSHNTESIIEFTDKDDKDPENQKSNSLQVSSNLVNQESVSSGYQQSHEEISDNESRFYQDFPQQLVKSNSLPFLESSLSKLVDQSQSTDDLKALERVETEKNTTDDSSDSCNHVGSAKDWIVPGVDESGKEKKIQEDYTGRNWDRLANKDFKVKRIEKWVMDLHYTPVNEVNKPVNLDNRVNNARTTILDCSATSRMGTKGVRGMDAAKSYISSLSGSSSTAHLANHGLVTIPFLSAYTNMKELNLSGNTIVRITAGILPKGLHILNLSKNNISVIEGLRELTRIRALDLSYNRILRIGHGLAACSSLKELYLAGNKISEVEGLHRLLKLKVLDLRFNKLSTTKNLGQLAANYNSLQAIGLEGNPAQKNVGDEHLKKYLTGLLPHLAYYNRQSIKPGSLKDPVNRAAQLGSLDRSMRKSTHCRKSQPTSSHARHVRLPPSGMKTVNVRHNYHDLSNKRMTIGSKNVIRRTRSEGILLRAA
ncbi:unnamed protein product [Lactuca saligna]|uniref:Uncharacterized protein n=1 Tax=Lactuca saligna TaxID=75948 RepID=A0AA35YTU8_LACSI|nr:unnamed protein product [Lactuca saligna]